jgi:hypothetical protein
LKREGGPSAKGLQKMCNGLPVIIIIIITIPVVILSCAEFRSALPVQDGG